MGCRCVPSSCGPPDPHRRRYPHPPLSFFSCSLSSFLLAFLLPTPVDSRLSLIVSSRPSLLSLGTRFLSASSAAGISRVILFASGPALKHWLFSWVFLLGWVLGGQNSGETNWSRISQCVIRFAYLLYASSFVARAFQGPKQTVAQPPQPSASNQMWAILVDGDPNRRRPRRQSN